MNVGEFKRAVQDIVVSLARMYPVLYDVQVNAIGQVSAFISIESTRLGKRSIDRILREFERRELDVYDYSITTDEGYVDVTFYCQPRRGNSP